MSPCHKCLDTLHIRFFVKGERGYKIAVTNSYNHVLKVIL